MVQKSDFVEGHSGENMGTDQVLYRHKKNERQLILADNRQAGRADVKVVQEKPYEINE